MVSVSTPMAPIRVENVTPLLPSVKERTATMVLSAIHEWPYWEEIKAVAQKEYDVSAERFHELLPEYQRFLGLVMLGNVPIGMFSLDIDKIWHAHVLAMHQYAHFCLTLHGSMIQHIPQVPLSYHEGAICTTCKSCTNCSGGGQGGGGGDDEGETMLHRADSARMFYTAYEEAYNAPPPMHIWDLSVAEGLCVSA